MPDDLQTALARIAALEDLVFGIMEHVTGEKLVTITLDKGVYYEAINDALAKEGREAYRVGYDTGFDDGYDEGFEEARKDDPDY